MNSSVSWVRYIYKVHVYIILLLHTCINYCITLHCDIPKDQLDCLHKLLFKLQEVVPPQMGMVFAPFESENGYRLRIFDKVLSRWQKLWSRWRKKKLTPKNAWKFAHALCCLVPRPHSFGEMQGCCVWLWWLNDERYSELRQDFLVFQEQNFADPRFVFCGNCSHVICRRLFVGGEFMWNSQGIVDNPFWSGIG